MLRTNVSTDGMDVYLTTLGKLVSMEKWNFDVFKAYALRGDETDGSASLQDRLDAANWYAKRALEKLGAGAARTVYSLPNERVLKIAQDSGGVKQNKHELDAHRKGKDLPLTKVFDSDEEGLWLIAERVEPLRDLADFVSEFGYDPDDLADKLFELESERKEPDPKTEGENVAMAYHVMRKLDLYVYDVAEIEHWGRTSSGRLVLLDYGYTNEMYRS